MKSIFIILLFLGIINSSVLAQRVIDAASDDISSTENIRVDLTSEGSSFNIFEERFSGTSSAPHQVYIPFGNSGTDSGTGQTYLSYSYHSNRANLPLTTGENVDTSSYLTFYLDITVGSVKNDLHVAINDNGTYKVILYQGQINGDSDYYPINLDLEEICSSSIVECSELDRNSNPSSDEPLEATLYFFLAQDNLDDGDVVTPSGSEGVYYNIKMSNKIYYTRTVEVSNLYKGDGQLLAEFLSFSMGDDVRSLYAARSNQGEGLCEGLVSSDLNTTVGSQGQSEGSLLRLDSVFQNGIVKVRNLENDNCYNIQLFVCDKYGFCSRGSEVYRNTPEPIEALLEKQACFIFSAGFGHEHFITDYFQKWRDEFLKSFWLGRQFINFYYKSAPKYTPYILQNPWLQKSIQLLAYALYGLIRFAWIALFFIPFAIVQWRRKKNCI